MSEDYYALLGVDPEASEEAILEAYREKAAEHHPDVSDAPDADAAFQRLNQAKEVLTDESERRLYDQWGHDRYVDRAESDTRPSSSTGTPEKPPRSNGRSRDRTRRTRFPVGMKAALGQLFGELEGSHRSTQSGITRDRYAHSPAGAAAVVDLEPRIRRARSSTKSPSESPETSGGQCPKCRGRGTFVHDYDTNRGRGRRIEPCGRCGGTGALEK